MCLCKFGQNPPIGSGDKVQTSSNADADADTNTDRIGTKSNMSRHPGFALPVAIVAKCEEKIFLAQKNFIWQKQLAKKNSPPKKSAPFGLFYVT